MKIWNSNFWIGTGEVDYWYNVALLIRALVGKSKCGPARAGEGVSVNGSCHLLLPFVPLLITGSWDSGKPVIDNGTYDSDKWRLPLTLSPSPARAGPHFDFPTRTLLFWVSNKGSKRYYELPSRDWKKFWKCSVQNNLLSPEISRLVCCCIARTLFSVH
jgi:hypothetical protein